MSCFRLTVVAATLLTLVAHEPAQTASDATMKPCDRPSFRQFDFWLGDWEVRDAAGKQVGRNIVTSEQGGCVVMERWQSATGSTGMSMNYFEPRSGRWRQNWVSPDSILEMSGGLQGESMVLEGPMQYVGEDRTTLLRGTWTRLADGRVRQHFVESRDGGQTWEEWFDGYYSRAE